MANDVLLGVGRAAGMFYQAPAGTALPTDLSTPLPKEWVDAGDISEDGIKPTKEVSSEKIKNWAKVTKRNYLTDHAEGVEAPILSTTEASMKVIYGEDNVTKNGKFVTVNLSDNKLPAPKAYLFLMKDGDTLIGYGASTAQITKVEAPEMKDGALVWKTTIEGIGDSFRFIFGEDA